MEKVLLMTFSALTLSACVTTPTTNIAEFGLSVTQVSQQINTNLDELSELALQSQADSLAYLTLNQSRDQLCQGSASEIIQGEVLVNPAECNIPLRLSDLDSIIDPTSPLLRKQMVILEANQQLTTYANALTQLANVSSKVEIQQSSIKLTSALSSLNDSYLDLRYAKDSDRETIITTQQQQFHDNEAIISTAVAGFASAITEEKRRSALKEVITQGERVIEKLVPVIISELNQVKLHQSMATLELSALSDELIQYNQASLKRPQKQAKAAENIMDFHQRYIAIQAAALKDQQVIKAFNQIAISHREITQQVNKDRFSSKEIVSAISQLNKEYKALRSFKKLLASCEGKIIKGDDGFLTCNT